MCTYLNISKDIYRLEHSVSAVDHLRSVMITYGYIYIYIYIHIYIYLYIYIYSKTVR